MPGLRSGRSANAWISACRLGEKRLAARGRFGLDRQLPRVRIDEDSPDEVEAGDLMGYTGVLEGNQIKLDQKPSIPDGTRVHVEIREEVSPRRGSPAAVLRLVGSLSASEADTLMAASLECRRIDADLWTNGR
jgi:hypothetical protein